MTPSDYLLHHTIQPLGPRYSLSVGGLFNRFWCYPWEHIFCELSRTRANALIELTCELCPSQFKVHRHLRTPFNFEKSQSFQLPATTEKATTVTSSLHCPCAVVICPTRHYQRSNRRPHVCLYEVGTNIKSKV